MTRVSENSSFHSIGYSIGKTKARLEKLQLKGSNLKKIQKPSDSPIGNVELLTARSREADSKQYLRNANYAKTQLTFIENAIEELTDILVKSKELAIGQASSLYGPEVRQGIAKEIHQIREQALSIGNRRLGNRFVFSGYKSLTKPFDNNGDYKGDKNTMTVEITRDFFVPIGFNGSEIFYSKGAESLQDYNDPSQFLIRDQKPEQAQELELQQVNQVNRDLASQDPMMPQESLQETNRTIFEDLESLENALLTDNHEIVQALLPTIDSHLDRLITFRTKIGSIMNSIDATENSIEKNQLLTADYKSKIEDADVAELFTDLARQKAILEATYKSSAQMMNKSLLKFVN